MGPDNDAFLVDLMRGRAAEILVAVDLLDAGLTVRMHPVAKAVHPGEAPGFADEQDILVAGCYVIEVKSSTYEWTSVEDFPFPAPYVCTVKRWESRERKPDAFVFYSQPTGAKLALSSKTSPEWFVKDSYDQRRGWVTPTLCAPRSRLKSFDSLVGHLRRLESPDSSLGRVA